VTRTPALLAVDAGTSAIKTVAFAPDGTELAAATRENEVLRPAPGRAEQDMEATWTATAATVESVVSSLPPDATPVGVGLTGQGDGCWAVDAGGDPVRNAILWSDSRAAGILDEWEADGRLATLVERCGSALYPGTSLPLLAWLAREEPGTFDRVATVLSCKDWLGYRLTGERAVDRSQATVPYLDRSTETLDPAVFDVVDLPGARGVLPSLVSPTEPLGTVTAGAAAETGLPEGLPVVSALIDVAATALGSGAVGSDAGAVTLGTSLVTQTLTEGPRSETAGVQMALGVEGLWTYAIGSNAGTPSLDWLRETVAAGAEFEALAAAADAVPVGSDGLLYHPYLTTAGERGPFVDPDARAQFLGLTAEHDAEHLVRAVYEGLSLAVRDCVAHLPGDLGAVHAGGGGARSPFWCRLLADVLDADVVVPEGSEFGARGAAVVLGLALGEYPDLATAVDRTFTPAERYAPRSPATEQYDRLYDLYREVREEMTGVWASRAETVAAVRDADDGDGPANG
jgi:xylulokinase